jgi:hypothetical protein
MLPLRDLNPSHRPPVVTALLIALNAAVFLHELRLGRGLNEFLLFWGIVPVRYTVWDVARQFGLVEQVLPFFSSMFLHGGWLHLIGNMWTLWIFGDNVEERLGRGRYLLLYLGSGLAAGVLHIVTNPASTLPTIGASGAVAGVMGTYLRFFPQARIETIVPPFFFWPVFQLPAVIFLGWWFLLQFFNGTLSLAAAGGSFGGVAWWAHVGGFVYGLWMAQHHRRRERGRRISFDEEP